MKKVTLSDLKINDIVEINQIVNTNGLILAVLEGRNRGEMKSETLIEIKPGARLIFQKVSPAHFNDVLFLIPGVSDNAEIWISESVLRVCRFTLVTKK